MSKNIGYLQDKDGNSLFAENKTTAHLTINCSMNNIQDVINSLSKNINHQITLEVSGGTINDNIIIEGFYGSGSLRLHGAITTSVTHSLLSLTIRNCILPHMYIRGFNATATNTTCFSFENCVCPNTIFEYCSATGGVNTTNNNYGFWGIWSVGLIYIRSSTFSNKVYSIISTGTTKILTHSITGANNDVAFLAENAGQLHKRTPASTITATTLNTVSSGGVIFNNTNGTIIS